MQRFHDTHIQNNLSTTEPWFQIFYTKYLQRITRSTLLWWLLSAALAAAFALGGYLQGSGQHIADSVLRLHIVANSDSPEDQQLKLQVRDRVLQDCSSLFAHCRTMEESIRIAQAHINRIQASAQDEIQRQGYDYTAQVQVKPSCFPTKRYDGVVLPAGTYQAVTITLGTAEGQNWWCVMYPPLCLINGVTHVPSASLKQLREILTPEEFELITQSENPPVKVKFKIVELLNQLHGNKE